MLNLSINEGYIATELTFVSKDTQQHCKFKIAVPRDYKESNGNTPADFIPCIAFGVLAENLALNFKKGDRIIVCGRMESHKYTDKEGQNRYDLTLKIEKWYFGEPKPKSPEYYAEIFNS